jgi:hypothetical protein
MTARIAIPRQIPVYLPQCKTDVGIVTFELALELENPLDRGLDMRVGGVGTRLVCGVKR